MKILFIKNIQEANYIVKNNLHLDALNCLVTEDMTAAYFLKEKNINFIDILDELSQKKIEEHINVAYIKANNISKYLSKNSRYNNFNFTNINQDLVYPLQIIENAKFFFYKLAKKFTINEFVTFESNKVGLIRTGPKPAKDPASYITESVLLQICKNLNININFLKITSTNKKNKKIKNFFLYSKKNITNVINKKKNKTILLYRDSLSFEEFNKIHSILEKTNKYQIITISNNLIKELSPQNSKINVKILLKDILRAFASLEDPVLKDNPFMRFQFECIANEIIEADVLSNNFSLLLKSININLLILGHDAFTKERALVDCAHSLNVETLSFFHGGAGSIFGARGVVGNSKYVLLWNEADLNCMKYYNYPNHFIVTGPLKSIKAEKINKRNKNNFLLLTTAISTGLAAPLVYPSAHRESLKKILVFLNSSNTKSLRIKSHPNYDYDELYYLLADKNNQIIFDQNKDLQSSAKNLNIVIMLNYFSTAALYFYKVGIPVIFIDEDVFGNEEWMNTYDIFHSKTIRLSKTSDLEDEVKRLESRSYRKKIIAEQQKLLNKIIPFSEKNTEKNILNVINEVLQIKKLKNKKYFSFNNYSSKNLEAYIAGINHQHERQDLCVKILVRNSNFFIRGFLSCPTTFYSLIKFYFIALITLNKIKTETHREILQFVLMKRPEIFNFNFMKILLIKIFRINIKNEP